MKKVLVLVSLLLLASLSIARAESPNFSMDQVSKQDSFMLALLAQPDRDHKVTDLLIGRSKPLIIAAQCNRACERDIECSGEPCLWCIKGVCRPADG
ncbi:MAG: hypothetical protein HC889_16775 [Synechococcaceae cyanobacterium SM1_2_3]|nr:hypothetical protein [Synechococcaceae cyanobacterium SM1_2_3]